MEIELTHCDLCNGSEYSQLFPASPLCENIDPQIYYSERRTSDVHFSILKCKSCGLIRSSAFDGDLPRVFIPQNYVTNPFANKRNQIKTLQKWIHPISNEAILGGTLLDIGCSGGIFIAEAMRLGWQAVGIDSSEKAASNAQQFAPWAKIYVSPVESAIFPAQSFRVITYWDGFAQVKSPKKALQRLTPWLVPGGNLLFTIPNIQSPSAKILGAGWSSLLRENSWYFSPNQIKELLKDNGYDHISFHPAPIFVSSEDLSKRLRFTAGINKQFGHLINLTRVFNHLSYWVNSGNMLVTARLKEINE